MAVSSVFVAGGRLEERTAIVAKISLTSASVRRGGVDGDGGGAQRIGHLDGDFPCHGHSCCLA